MGLFSFLEKGLTLLFKPGTFKTGEQFENYVYRRIFPNRNYELLQRTYNYNVKGKNYVPSSNPDFKFRDRRTSKIFYVEAKYRKNFYDGKISWCSEKQLKNYWRCNYAYPVFVLIGIGGEPNRPNFLSLIPLRHANFTELFVQHVGKFEIKTHTRVSSRMLWRR